MTQLHPITGRSTTMFRKQFISTVAAAAAILAFSVSAAQASPTGLGYTDHAQSQSAGKGYIGTYRPIQSKAAEAQVMSPAVDPANAQQLPVASVQSTIMSPAVDPANAQQVPVEVTQAQPVAATDSGFNWTAALLGAGIATVVLLLAGATASRIRPRRVAQF
jgi:hypothetical protein